MEDSFSPSEPVIEAASINFKTVYHADHECRSLSETISYKIVLCKLIYPDRSVKFMTEQLSTT